MPTFLHFFMIFPEKSPLLVRFPRLVTWLYLPFLLVFIPILAAQLFLLLFPQLLKQFVSISNLYGSMIRLLIILSVGYLAAGLISLLINYRAATTINRR